MWRWKRKRQRRPVKVAVVTGGNRGIGFATVRLLCRKFKGKVIMTTRKDRPEAVKRLNDDGCFPDVQRLDVCDAGSRTAFGRYVNRTYGGVDALVNNAGVMFHANDTKTPYFEQVRRTLDVNFFGTLYMCQLLFPMLRRHARIVNLSASCGHLTDIPSKKLRRRFDDDDLTEAELAKLVLEFRHAVHGRQHVKRGWGNDSYSVSKVAVAALTVVQQEAFDQRPDDDLVVNTFNPGNVTTRITGFNGQYSPNHTAREIVKLMTLPEWIKTPVGVFIWHDFGLVHFNHKKPQFEEDWIAGDVGSWP